MDLLSPTGLALVLVAFVVIVLGAVKDRPRIRQAGTATNALGCAVLAAHYGVAGSWGLSALFAFLALVNVYSHCLTRRVEARKANA